MGGELFTLLNKQRRFSEASASMYTAQVASAFGFLGARLIAHRDLKLENLLLDEKGYLKLVDFGFAKVVQERTWTFCGTPDYLAPEIVGNKGHNGRGDLSFATREVGRAHYSQFLHPILRAYEPSADNGLC